MQWDNTFKDREGRVVDPKALKKLVFYGGVEPDLRPEVLFLNLSTLGFAAPVTERK